MTILYFYWKFAYLERWTYIEMKSSLWFNSSPPSAAYMRQWVGSALIQIMACRLFGARPLSKQMLGYCQLDP